MSHKFPRFHSSEESDLPIKRSQQQKPRSPIWRDFLSAIDEAPEFHDPYSELNLFLARKIKREMRHCESPKKWSPHLGEQLFNKISPEFQQRFPRYRLGSAALKKTWEKVNYYALQIQEEKEALTQEGKVNVSFFIKENLRSQNKLKHACHLHPYHYAHQLAMKMSECIAVVDGTRPQIDQLTKTIWSVQRHLIPSLRPEESKSPCDDYDPIDRLIAKTLLEITARLPHMTQAALSGALREQLRTLKQLPKKIAEEKRTAIFSGLVADAFTTRRHPAPEREAALPFLRQQLDWTKRAYPHLDNEKMVRRLVGLYDLAQLLPKDLTEDQLDQILASLYGTVKRSDIPQELISFLSANKVLLEKQGRSEATQASKLKQLYFSAIKLPPLTEDEVKIATWHTLCQTEGLLEKLPFNAGKLLYAELNHQLIDHPTASFDYLVEKLKTYLDQLVFLEHAENWQTIERKIHNWTMQGEMLLRWVRIDHETPLYKALAANLDKINTTPLRDLIAELAWDCTRKHPTLTECLPDLEARLWMMLKHLWYTKLAPFSESTFDRFLKWHARRLKENHPDLPVDELVKKLESTCTGSLPLVPFDSRDALRFFETKPQT
jgi:hypothetical protein